MINSVNTLLEDGYAVLREDELAQIDRLTAPRAVLDAMEGHPQAASFAAMAQAFCVFRRLHSMEGDAARLTLLGDHFFSLFSGFMIPLDSPWLIDRFAQRLDEECSGGGAKEPYELFLKRTCKEYVELER